MHGEEVINELGEEISKGKDALCLILHVIFHMPIKTF